MVQQESRVLWNTLMDSVLARKGCADQVKNLEGY